MTPEEFKQSEIGKTYLPAFGGPHSEFDRGAAHGYSEGFDAALRLIRSTKLDVTNIPKNVTEYITVLESDLYHQGLNLSIASERIKELEAALEKISEIALGGYISDGWRKVLDIIYKTKAQ